MKFSAESTSESLLTTSLDPDFAFLTLPSPEQLLAVYSKQKILFSFDFDGTLVSLASSPERIEFGPSVRRTIERVAARRRIVICSGRALKDLAVYMPQCPGLDLIGNHGFEWRVWRDSGQGPRIHDVSWLPPAWDLWRDRALPRLLRQVQLKGGELEDKHATITVHFALSGEEWWGSPDARPWIEREILPLLTEVVGEVRLIPGTKAWNILPPGTTKGKALIRYAREFGYSLIVYFGDEATDETVFLEKELPLIGVKVGEGQTAARYRVPDVRAVQLWLGQLSMLESGLM